MSSEKNLVDRQLTLTATATDHDDNASSSAYAQVLLDVQIKGLKDRLFTYCIPISLQSQAFVGSQVLVPFGGRQLLAGYIVGMTESHDLDKAPKDIHEVVEPEPLFDQTYIDFLAYVAKKYCASLQEVIAAAIPACLTTRIKRLVKVSAQGLALKALSPADRITELEQKCPCQNIIEKNSLSIVCDLLLESARGTLNITTLRQRFEHIGRRYKPKLNLSHFHKALNKLQSAAYLEVEAVQDGASEAKTRRVLDLGAEPGATEKQKNILNSLLAAGHPLTFTELIESASTSRSTIDKMVSLKMLAVEEEIVVRDRLDSLPQSLVDKNRVEPPLTDEQEKVFATLQQALMLCLNPDPKKNPAKSGEPVVPWLLHGVTGSGKTEIYLRLISETLKYGRTALFLVPEISLTPQLAGRLKGRFGKLVAVWHSAISVGERYDTFQRLRNGEVKVLLGARSAILAHIPDLGLIVLDEEHDSSYKQTSPSPRYHARHLASEKAGRAGALVLLGSATPDVVSYFEADLAVESCLCPVGSSNKRCQK